MDGWPKYPKASDELWMAGRSIRRLRMTSEASSEVPLSDYGWPSEASEGFGWHPKLHPKYPLRTMDGRPKPSEASEGFGWHPKLHPRYPLRIRIGSKLRTFVVHHGRYSSSHIMLEVCTTRWIAGTHTSWQPIEVSERPSA